MFVIMNINAIFVHNNEERASFKLMWKMTGRERLFKQTLFPSIGYIVIIGAVQFVNKPQILNDPSKSDNYLFFLYILMFISMTLPSALLTGNNRQAAWIFKTVPMSSPASFFKGSIKAAFSKFLAGSSSAISRKIE